MNGFNTSLDKKICYLDELASKIQNNTNPNSSNLWDSQKKCIEKISSHIKKGNNKGLIIHPGGGGKTRIIGEIAKRIGLPTLILVHQKDEIELMKNKLVGTKTYPGSGFVSEEIYSIYKNESSNITDLFNDSLNFLSGNNESKIIIASYSGIRTLYKCSKDTFNNFFAKIHFIASDEAHESLGKVTKKSYDKIDKLLLDTDKEIVENLIQNNFKRLHLFFTATPQLGSKNVVEHHNIEIIDHYTFGELVKAGKAIIPKNINVGNAIYTTNSNKPLHDNEINSHASKFEMQNGDNVYCTISDKYIELKNENNGNLPAISFCTTIEQAEYITNYLNKKGIRSIRATSGNNHLKEGTPLIEAKRLIEEGKIDNIVTVKKGIQALDIPNLRAALWFAPKYSPKDKTQAMYRITRVFSNKNSENTYNIEPTWIIAKQNDKSYNSKLSGLKLKNKNITKNQINIRGERLDVLFESQHWLKTLIKYNEINKSTLSKILSSEDYKKILKIISEVIPIKKGNTNDTIIVKSRRKPKLEKKDIDKTIGFSFKKIEKILNNDVINDTSDLNTAFRDRDLSFIKKYGALELIEKVKKYPIDWEKYSFDEVYSAALLNYYEYLEKKFHTLIDKKQRSQIFPKIKEDTMLEFYDDYNSCQLTNKILNQVTIDFRSTLIEQKILDEELESKIEQLIDTLDEKQKKVIYERIYNSNEDITLRDVSKSMKIQPERVRQIGVSALKIMKHPKILRKLQNYIEICTTPDLYEYTNEVKSKGTEILHINFNNEYFSNMHNIKYDLNEFRKRLGYTKVENIVYRKGEFNHLIIKASNGNLINFGDYLGLYKLRYLKDIENISRLNIKEQNIRYKKIIDNLIGRIKTI